MPRMTSCHAQDYTVYAPAIWGLCRCNFQFGLHPLVLPPGEFLRPRNGVGLLRALVTTLAGSAAPALVQVAPQAVDFGFFLPGRPLGTFAGSSYPMPLPR